MAANLKKFIESLAIDGKDGSNKEILDKIREVLKKGPRSPALYLNMEHWHQDRAIFELASEIAQMVKDETGEAWLHPQQREWALPVLH